MPNICYCSLEAPNSILKMLCDDSGYVDFNNFLPVNIDSPSQENNKQDDVWGARMNSALNGYVLSETSGVLYFSTAWKVPWKLLTSLSKTVKDVEIVLSWQIEDGESGYGCCRFINGDVSSSAYPNILDDVNSRQLFFDAVCSMNPDISPSNIYQLLHDDVLRPGFGKLITVDDVECFVVVDEHGSERYCAYNRFGEFVTEINPFGYTSDLVQASVFTKQRNASRNRLNALRQLHRSSSLRKWWLLLTGNSVEKQRIMLENEFLLELNSNES